MFCIWNSTKNFRVSKDRMEGVKREGEKDGQEEDKEILHKRGGLA